MNVKTCIRLPGVTDWSLPVTVLSSEHLAVLPVPNSLDLSHPAVGKLTVLSDDGSPSHAMAEEIVFTIAREPFTLRCQRPILPPLLRRAGHAVDKPVLQGDPALAALVFEHLLTPALEVMETRNGFGIQVLAIRRPVLVSESEGRVTRLRLVSDLWPAVVQVELQTHSANGDAMLNSILAEIAGPPSQPPLHLPSPLALLSPEFQVPLIDVQALCPGDALILDDRWSPQAEVHVGLRGNYKAPAVWINGHLNLTCAPKRLPGKDISPMTLADPEAAFTVDELPVTVTLELDRIDLPFSAIAGLKEGSILPFGTPMPETVRVLVNGRAFATAGLVQIDGQLGIRITAMTGKSV